MAVKSFDPNQQNDTITESHSITENDVVDFTSAEGGISGPRIGFISLGCPKEKAKSNFNLLN
jgi:hypothetical protein